MVVAQDEISFSLYTPPPPILNRNENLGIGAMFWPFGISGSLFFPGWERFAQFPTFLATWQQDRFVTISVSILAMVSELDPRGYGCFCLFAANSREFFEILSVIESVVCAFISVANASSFYI